METKICPKCGVEKSLDGFFTNKRRPEGKHHICRMCMAARARERRAAWTDEQRAQHCAAMQRWRAAHPDYYREYRATYKAVKDSV